MIMMSILVGVLVPTRRADGRRSVLLELLEEVNEAWKQREAPHVHRFLMIFEGFSWCFIDVHACSRLLDGLRSGSSLRGGDESHPCPDPPKPCGRVEPSTGGRCAIRRAPDGPSHAGLADGRVELPQPAFAHRLPHVAGHRRPPGPHQVLPALPAGTPGGVGVLEFGGDAAGEHRRGAGASGRIDEGSAILVPSGTYTN